MNLFKKHKHSAYGASWEDYPYQDYIPEKLDYYLRVTILRLWHILTGHKWGKWSKLHYVAEGETGFATADGKQTRKCGCHQAQARNWNKKTQLLLQDMQRRWGKALKTGLIGELYGVRFVLDR